MHDVTQILTRAERGEAQAVEALLPLVYEELRRLTTHRMALEASGPTPEPAALVHESWLQAGRRYATQGARLGAQHQLLH